MTKRLYTADTIAKGVKTVAAIRSKVFPFGTSPQLGAPSPVTSSEPTAPPPEMLEGHCLGCPRGEDGKPRKHVFQVEGEDKMPNGTVRKYGKCPNGHKISHLVSGAASGNAA